MDSRKPPEVASDSVTVARINALQAVVVAVVAALAGIAGTAGIKYWDGNRDLEQARAEVVKVREENESRVAALQRRVKQLESQARPSLVLQVKRTKLDQEACFRKLTESLFRHVQSATGGGGVGRLSSEPGSLLERGGIKVRFICEQPEGRLILVVAGAAGAPSADTESLATKLLSDLSRE